MNPVWFDQKKKKKIEISILQKSQMNIQSKNNQHTIFPSTAIDISQLNTNKITFNHPKKIKTQSIQPSQIQTNYKKELSLAKSPMILSNIQIRKKHRIIKPFKDTLQQSLSRLKLQADKNITASQNHESLYPNLFVRRNGCTAPIRKRIKSQANKQNLNSEDEKLFEKCKEKEPTKVANMKSLSSIFNDNSKSKLNNLPNFIKFSSKPHMVLCFSRLPKDFFGQNSDTPINYSRNLVNLNRNPELQQKKLQYASSVKTLSKYPVQKLNFKNKESELANNLNGKEQTAFTFRKGQNSKKHIPKIQQPIYAINPSFENKFQIIKMASHPNNSAINIHQMTIHNARKKIHRKNSRDYLKL